MYIAKYYIDKKWKISKKKQLDQSVHLKYSISIVQIYGKDKTN